MCRAEFCGFFEALGESAEQGGAFGVFGDVDRKVAKEFKLVYLLLNGSFVGRRQGFFWFFVTPLFSFSIKFFKIGFEFCQAIIDSALLEHFFQPVCQRVECAGYGKGGGSEQFAKDEGYELPLGVWKRIQGLFLEVFGNHVVQRDFIGSWKEVFGEGDAVGVPDVFKHLTAERSVAQRGKTGFEFVECSLCGDAGVLCFEAFIVAKGVAVDHADQTIQLHQGVLQWCGGQKNFGGVEERRFYCLGNFVVGFIDVAQAV